MDVVKSVEAVGSGSGATRAKVMISASGTLDAHIFLTILVVVQHIADWFSRFLYPQVNSKQAIRVDESGKIDPVRFKKE